MQKQRGLFFIAAMLVILSAAIYALHYTIFHDAHHILLYLVGDLAFLPLEVLLVGIVVERIMSKRENDEKVQKLNMVVGAFFSEIGHRMSAMFLDSTTDKEKIIENLNATALWQSPEYKKAKAFAQNTTEISFDKIDLDALKLFLISKRPFMLTLIENPNLLEHERFTDLLLSSFHLTEELESRPSLNNLPTKDIAHINGDIKRAFQHLVIEWLDYMQHLKSNYPFLYSHYLRIHPFQAHPSAVIE